MNMYAIFELTTGNVRNWQNSPLPPDDDALAALGLAALPVPDDVDTSTTIAQKISNGALISRVATLAENKQTKQRAALAYFTNLFFSGFTYAGILYQVDEQRSQNKITAMGADADRSLRDPITFPWDDTFYWIAADNSHVTMTAMQMALFSQSVAKYVRQCQYQISAVKKSINNAVDQAALDAIDVTAGYPVSSGS